MLCFSNIENRVNVFTVGNEGIRRGYDIICADYDSGMGGDEGN